MTVLKSDDGLKIHVTLVTILVFLERFFVVPHIGS